MTTERVATRPALETGRVPAATQGPPAPGRRERRLLLVLVGAHVVMVLVLLARVWHVPVVGDEAQYADGGRALANLLRHWGALRGTDTTEVDRNVVASGWFMPGMSVVLAPLYLLVPHASLGVARVYLATFHTALLLLAARDARRTLGLRYAVALLVVPGLVPVWVLYSTSAWGDLAAGLLVVVLLCQVVRIARAALAGTPPSVREGIRLGMVAIATLYLRSSAAPLVAAVLLVPAAAAVVLRGPDRRRALAAAAAAVACCGALLLPWSLYASHVLGGRVVTTTTVPTALAVTFGDRGRLCYGPCDPGSTIWFAPLRYARETARATGVSEVVVLDQMSAYARRDVTPTSYARQVGEDAHRFLLRPGAGEVLFRPGTTNHGAGAPDLLTPWLRTGTWLLYGPVLAGGVLALLLAVRGPRERQVRLLAVKVFTAALVVQPFVHVSSPRYWPSFVPVLTIGTVLVVEVLAGRLRGGPVGDRPAGRIARVLHLAQVALTVGFVAVVAVLGALALQG